ncbi:MAG: hypothetical protein IH808_05490 [Proteobacteria bacterium]|nr:hypothetical protein [Pseudomonadota bacterium]
MPVDWLVMGLVATMAFAEPELVDPDLESDLELLEFLGSWETDDGEWIDPTMLADEPEMDVPADAQEND